ncbi:hypothetical protein Lfu02_43310 [Longispora fulva]|uniref:Uncharacterized protein n=1 Tax=Longispora fulva TaxID=619741 RepID=A0A8J7GAH5_9ACTN|nr:hypothetical protein [Longispora fulva]MBG6136788.1 hypothetical protein [Longispora fulva]GIG59959.1 hypothetical protein Lfu02_43310 [Longispora fulva]
MVEGTDNARQARFATWVTLITALPELITGGVLLWKTFGPTSPAEAQSQPAGPSATGSPAGPSGPSWAAPTATAGPGTPVPSPVVAPVPSPTVDRPLVGTACVPGVWKLQHAVGHVENHTGTLSLASEGYVMTFTALGGGLVDMGGGVWFAGQIDGQSTKVRTTGATGFRWQATAEGLSITYGASSLFATTYVDDVAKASGPDAYKDGVESFSCTGDSLRLVDRLSTSELTRIG